MDIVQILDMVCKSHTEFSKPALTQASKPSSVSGRNLAFHAASIRKESVGSAAGCPAARDHLKWVKGTSVRLVPGLVDAILISSACWRRSNKDTRPSTSE